MLGESTPGELSGPADAREVETFRADLAALRTVDPGRDPGTFRALARQLISAMEREVTQARAVSFDQGPPAALGEDAGDDASSAWERRLRMEQILDEVNGLKRDVARGNQEAIDRGLGLLDEFLATMEADLGPGRVER